MDVYVDSDNVVWLRGASSVNFATGTRTYLTGTATVNFRVQTTDHVDIPGGTWPETMQYIAGSQGDFIGVLRDTLIWEANRSYRLVATAVAGPDQKRTWDLPLRALVSQS